MLLQPDYSHPSKQAPVEAPLPYPSPPSPTLPPAQPAVRYLSLAHADRFTTSSSCTTYFPDSSCLRRGGVGGL